MKIEKFWQQTWLYSKIINLINIFLLDVNFHKFIVESHFLIISFIFTKFLEDQK